MRAHSFLYLLRRPPRSPLFPYTTLFRSTKRKGPDNTPQVSPDGKYIAYTGFDDKYQGYQVTRLYVMNRDGSESRLLTADLDREDRKSTRLNSSHRCISYAVFCLKKKSYT